MESSYPSSCEAGTGQSGTLCSAPRNFTGRLGMFDHLRLRGHAVPVNAYACKLSML